MGGAEGEGMVSSSMLAWASAAGPLTPFCLCLHKRSMLLKG